MKKMLSMTLILSCIIYAQTYVGSTNCQSCHTEKYSDWFDSGHPYKFNITNNAAPVYPDFVTNFQDVWDDSIGFTWDQVSGVIGGFGWKARFVDQTGKLIGTANSVVNAGLGHNQFNFYDGTLWGIGNYHPADDKTYNYGCFRCHTTGPEEGGTWLAGVADLGTFAEGGVGCEACHGPGSNHVSDPSTSNIDRVYEFNISDTTGLDFGGTIGVVAPDPNGDDVNYLCGTCHNRGFNAPIEAKGGYIKHHEVWEESLTWDGHSFMSCTSCHDPHKRVIWDGDGITMDCTTCHADQVATLNHSGTSNCVDCHMPYAGKSAVKRGESGYKGDINSHLFKITVDDQSMFTDDGHYVKDDSERPASLDLGFACLGCHNDDPNDAIPEKTIAEAVIAAANMHGTASISAGNSLPDKFQLSQNYPNPFNPMTVIPFDIQTAGHVKLVIYNLLGQEMAVLADEYMTPGEYKLNLNAQSLATGVYIYDITVDNSEMGIVFKDSKKMVIMK